MTFLGFYLVPAEGFVFPLFYSMLVSVLGFVLISVTLWLFIADYIEMFRCPKIKSIRSFAIITLGFAVSLSLIAVAIALFLIVYSRHSPLEMTLEAIATWAVALWAVWQINWSVDYSVTGVDYRLMNIARS